MVGVRGPGESRTRQRVSRITKDATHAPPGGPFAARSALASDFAALQDRPVESIHRRVKGSECHIQEVKTIYYRDSQAFRDYTVFRASRTRSKGKSGTFSAPGVDNLSSDQFSFEAWRKLVS